MIKDNDVQVLHNAAGADKCPAGMLALYTNINFNNDSAAGETSDILIMPPNMQLDTEALEGYGFIVGEHDGVSSVVNNMSQIATLVSGTHLDGDILPVAAGEQISSLVDYLLSSGDNWNDATNSVVSKSVTTVDLTMQLESNITLQQDETYYALLEINNSSATSITGATVESSSDDETIFTVSSTLITVDIPANAMATVRIPVTAVNSGTATLNCTLNTPLGIINSGNNVCSATVDVTEERQLQVVISSVSHWADVWPSTQILYSYNLMMSAAETAVTKWELSFLLPEGAALNQSWLDTSGSWVTLNADKSVNGSIYLDSQPNHVISPGVNVPLNIQIDYPDASDAHNTLNNLRLMQLG